MSISLAKSVKTLQTPNPALPPVGEGFGMGVSKIKFIKNIN